jgi:hypothetical protein
MGTDNVPAIALAQFEVTRPRFPPKKQAQLQAFMGDGDLANAIYGREQIAIARKHLGESKGNERLTFEEIGRLFCGVSGSVIERQYKSAQEEQHEPGEHSLLSPKLQEWIMELVTSRLAEQHPIIYAELVDSLQYLHRIVLSGDCLRHSVHDIKTLKSIVETPIESERVPVSSEAIDDGFAFAWLSASLPGQSRKTET